jgi:hypothetical protein
MRHDWSNTRKLLVAGSIPDFEAFFKVHPLSDVLAIGYTWECRQLQAAFYAVANTLNGLEKGMISANIYAEPKLTPDQARKSTFGSRLLSFSSRLLSFSSRLHRTKR